MNHFRFSQICISVKGVFQRWPQLTKTYWYIMGRLVRSKNKKGIVKNVCDLRWYEWYQGLTVTKIRIILLKTVPKGRCSATPYP